jgi:probable rRNA maturation factor
MAVQVVVNLECQVPGLGPTEVARLMEVAVRSVLADRGVGSAEVSVTLLGDADMAALNREWKGRDRPTDVLAFPLFEEGEAPVGDVYLGVERALEQAASAGEPPGRELARLAVHATLHILGWDHPEEDRESSEMWGHQERIVGDLDLS